MTFLLCFLFWISGIVPNASYEGTYLTALLDSNQQLYSQTCQNPDAMKVIVDTYSADAQTIQVINWNCDHR